MAGLAPGSRRTHAVPLVRLTRRGNAPNRSQAARAAGLSRDQKREALRLARIPEAEFEAAIEYPKPATVTELAQRCRARDSTMSASRPPGGRDGDNRVPRDRPRGARPGVGERGSPSAPRSRGLNGGGEDGEMRGRGARGELLAEPQRFLDWMAQRLSSRRGGPPCIACAVWVVLQLVSERGDAVSRVLARARSRGRGRGRPREDALCVGGWMRSCVHRTFLSIGRTRLASDGSDSERLGHRLRGGYRAQP